MNQRLPCYNAGKERTSASRSSSRNVYYFHLIKEFLFCFKGCTHAVVLFKSETFETDLNVTLEAHVNWDCKVEWDVSFISIGSHSSTQRKISHCFDVLQQKIVILLITCCKCCPWNATWLVHQPTVEILTTSPFFFFFLILTTSIRSSSPHDSSHNDGSSLLIFLNGSSLWRKTKKVLVGKGVHWVVRKGAEIRTFTWKK